MFYVYFVQNVYPSHALQFESYGKCLSCNSGQEAEPVSVDFQTPLLSAHRLYHVGVQHHLPAVVVEVDLGVDGGEGEEGTGLENSLAHPVEHVLGPAQVPVDLPVNGIVAHPGVLALDINVEVAHGHGLEVPAEDALELPVGSDLNGDGGLVLLEGVCGPLDGGGEVLSAWQLGRLADCPVSPLEVDDGQLLSVEDHAPLVAGGCHNECLELGAVALHLQLASHLVGDRRINCLSVDVVEESGEEVGGVHVECVGSGHGGHSHLKGHPVVLHDGGFEAELVGESILVDPVNDDLHVSLPLVEAALAIQAEHLVEHGSAGHVEESVDGGGEGGGGDISLVLQHGLPVPDELDKVVWGAPHGHLHVADIGLDLQLLSNLVPSSHFDLVNSKEVPRAAHPSGADRLVPDQGVGSLGGVKLLLLELLSIHHTLVLEEHLAHHQVHVLLVVHDLGVPGSVGEALANLPAEEVVEDRHWVHVEVALHGHVEHVGIVDKVNLMVELGEGGSAASRLKVEPPSSHVGARHLEVHVEVLAVFGDKGDLQGLGWDHALHDCVTVHLDVSIVDVVVLHHKVDLLHVLLDDHLDVNRSVHVSGDKDS